jgi:hypothetical protein
VPPKASAGAAEAALRRSLVSAEREQHSGVVVERVTDAPGVYHARAMPVVEKMYRRNLLTARQCWAGIRIYSAWSIGIVGARDADSGGCTVHDPGGYRDRQLDAAREYREVLLAVGPRLWSLVWHVTCDDWSVERWVNEMGRGMDRKGAIALLRHGLDVAADHFGIE